MLVIQRKPGQRVVIAGRTVLTIIASSTGRVSLGFDGPDSVHREEVAEQREPGIMARLLQRLGEMRRTPRLAH